MDAARTIATARLPTFLRSSLKSPGSSLQIAAADRLASEMALAQEGEYSLDRPLRRDAGSRGAQNVSTKAATGANPSRHDGVEASRSLLACFDEAGLVEHREILRRSLLRYVDLGCDLTHGPRPRAQDAQDLHAPRFPESLEHEGCLAFRSFHKCVLVYHKPCCKPQA